MSIDKFRNKNVSMSIAGLDPSGGAGILADCKTFTSQGVYATCVVTAVTAQNPFKVTSIESIDLKVIEEQIDDILDVYPVEYIKTGMLYSSDIIKLVARKIRQYNLHAVVDPVMISESGKDLTQESYISSFNKYLLRNAYLITPNVSEAEKIANTMIKTQEDMVDTAQLIGKYTNVVITGGHMNGDDILVSDDKIHTIKGMLVNSNDTHGTGCSYSSCITSNLVKDCNLVDSCIKSREFIKNSIVHGFNNTPYQFWDSVEFKKN